MSARIIDFRNAAGRLRTRKGRVPAALSLEDLHRDLAAALRRIQAERGADEQAYDPWVRCPFHRVPVPAPEEGGKAGALALLVDDLDSYLVWRVHKGAEWRAEEFSTQPLHARVMTTPAGWITLEAMEPAGRAVEREVEVGAGEVVLLRVVPTGWRWCWDEGRWPISVKRLVEGAEATL